MSFLQELFLNVVNMSITASYVAIGVILVRLLLKKAPKVFSYILWIPVLFRLVCPFSFDSAFSFFNLINLNAKQGSGVSEFVPQNIGLMQTPVIQSGIGSIDSAANASLPSAIPVASANPMQVWLAVFSLIWVFGVIALFIYSIISYVKIKRKLQTATRVDGNVFETDAIGTAFVCGFIRPKIYVPANIGDANLSYILEHEHTHIRRKDYLIKPIAFLALILHWFNPLMWLCFALMSRDMEMSCDESVLRRLGDGAKGGYSNSLLSLSVKRKGLLAANPLAFGENHAKARIRNVLNFKKPAFWVIVAAVAAVCVAGFAFAANPSESAAYISEDYKISFKYPSSWKLNPNYIERYEGKDGFFQVGAINGENMSIDEVAKNDAFHKLQPYGSEPEIINRTIDGQEARLILPSADQPEEMKNQAGLIIKYPKAIKIDGSQYRYFILWADKTHIDQISNTLTFLIKQAGDENSPDKIASLIEENLAAIMSSPKNSSNPQDYINAHQTEYEAILALETQALPYLFAEFEKGGQTGLKGYIMQNLCWDILGEDNIQYASKDPQDWYDTFKKHVQRIAASSSVDSLRTTNPEYGALLDAINISGTEGIAKLVEENLAVIISSPKEASNPYAYIDMHKEEYEKILETGKEALPYLIDILESGDKGLRGNIAVTLCEDIVKRLLAGNKDVDLETEKLIKEALMAVDKWNAIMGNKSQEVIMPEFTEEEVAAARAVVEEYYRAVAAKDAEAILATMYPQEHLTMERVKSGNVRLFGTEKRTLLSIDYDSQDSMRKSYKPGGKYVEPENIIVFKVSFNIDYPDKDTGPWNEGVYENWSMILIRDDKNSPWLIYDQGY